MDQSTTRRLAIARRQGRHSGLCHGGDAVSPRSVLPRGVHLNETADRPKALLGRGFEPELIFHSRIVWVLHVLSTSQQNEKADNSRSIPLPGGTIRNRINAKRGLVLRNYPGRPRFIRILVVMGPTRNCLEELTKQATIEQARGYKTAFGVNSINCDSTCRLLAIFAFQITESVSAVKISGN